MKERQIKKLLLTLLLLTGQAAWADDAVEHLAFLETFNSTAGTGGHDGQFSGSVGQNKIIFDQDGWTTTKCGGADQCVKFGTGDTNGVLTTPPIILLGKEGDIHFDAAGWASGQKDLTVTANEGVILTGNTIIQLESGSWHNSSYVVHFDLGTADYLQITFTGRRGFIDEIKVTETVTAVNAPTLTDEHLFWPNTTEEATTNVTLIPSDSTTVYYTTDGSDPSKTNGHIATLTTNVNITGTTTVKARAYYTGYYYGDEKTVTSDLVTKTYTVGETVNSISAFKEKEDGDEVRLFIASDANARVLHGADGKMYLRDNTGTLCMDFGTTATFNPAPQHNQHVAGWIIGKKQTVDGLTKLVATGNTNTSHLALAAPVTEADTDPVSVAKNEDINSYVGNWVKAEDLRNGTPLNIQEVYDGALVDVSGIVTGENSILPVDYADIKPIVYVIDENEAFISPDADINQATVRLNRTLKAGQWNTFCVPFDIESMGANIREYDAIDGTTMKFKEAASIQAGKPYLIYPNADIENPVYSNVTLSAQPAQDIEKGGYAYVGIYSPKELAIDKTQLFLTNSGQLAYPSSAATATMKGMRAYFLVPKGANTRLYIDGDIVTNLSPNAQWSMVDGQCNDTIYNLTGQRVNKIQKGINIINGKKLIVK